MWIWGALLIVAVIAFINELYSLKTKVPTVTSFPSAREKIVEMLLIEQNKKPEGTPFTILDMGSGNGQLTWQIAKALPKAYVVGVELSLIPWAISSARQKLLGPKNLEYRRADFWNFDTSFADVIVLFLTENIIEKLGDKLRKELKQDAVIISNDTKMRGDWLPTETHKTGFMNFEVYLYHQKKNG